MLQMLLRFFAYFVGQFLIPDDNRNRIQAHSFSVAGLPAQFFPLLPGQVVTGDVYADEAGDEVKDLPRADSGARPDEEQVPHPNQSRRRIQSEMLGFSKALRAHADPVAR